MWPKILSAGRFRNRQRQGRVKGNEMMRFHASTLAIRRLFLILKSESRRFKYLQPIHNHVNRSLNCDCQSQIEAAASLRLANWVGQQIFGGMMNKCQRGVGAGEAKVIRRWNRAGFKPGSQWRCRRRPNAFFALPENHALPDLLPPWQSEVIRWPWPRR